MALAKPGDHVVPLMKLGSSEAAVSQGGKKPCVFNGHPVLTTHKAQTCNALTVPHCTPGGVAIAT
jgi:hypothetical protein